MEILTLLTLLTKKRKKKQKRKEISTTATVRFNYEATGPELNYQRTR